MDTQKIIEAVRGARCQPPYSQEPAFTALRQAATGTPVMVHTPAGEAATWLVPFIVQGMACGYAQVNLQGVVTRIGILGGAATDQAAWIPATYFYQPPEALLAEVRQQYAGAILSEPVFSYDRNPLRWAWRLSIDQEEAAPVEVFIAPDGWFAQPLEELHSGYE
jgi:hypothetical protein